MTTYIQERAYNERCHAEALEATAQKVTVEISLAAAWLFRDLIGLQQASDRAKVPLRDDMLALNGVVGFRPARRASDELPPPHVSGWSELAASRITGGQR